MIHSGPPALRDCVNAGGLLRLQFLQFPQFLLFVPQRPLLCQGDRFVAGLVPLQQGVEVVQELLARGQAAGLGDGPEPEAAPVVHGQLEAAGGAGGAVQVGQLFFGGGDAGEGGNG